jgi:hypothetical protein
MLLARSVLMLAIAVALHAAVSRLRPKGNRVVQFLACGACAGILLIVELRSAPPLGHLEPASSLAAYAFLCELYIFLFTFATSSVSVSMLLSGSAESFAPAENMVVKRVERMAGAGLVAREAGCLRLTDRGRGLVQVLRAARRVFHGDARIP